MYIFATYYFSHLHPLHFAIFMTVVYAPSIVPSSTIATPGLFSFLLKKLGVGQSLDLLILKELLGRMGGCDTLLDMSADQLEGMAGGRCLKAEVATVRLCVCVSVFIYISVRLSVCLSVCLSIYLGACLSVCLTVCPPVCVSVCASY